MTLRPLLIALSLAFAPLQVAHVALAETTLVPPGAQPSGAARIAALSDTLMIGPVMEVMRDEGMDYGHTLETEMFAGRGGDRWQAVVGGIYDAGEMRRRFDAALTTQLAEAGADLAQIEAFFGSAQGQRILNLEIDARRALLDSGVEDAAKVAWADMEGKNPKRAALIRSFVLANDLIESNVMGAMNSNLAFYRGMADSDSYPEQMTEQQMLEDVWGQEADVRSETEAWLYPYLALAYEPLPDSDLEAYIAFSESPAGKRMNAAMFAAFDVVFTQISADLGAASARQMQGDDI